MPEIESPPTPSTSTDSAPDITACRPVEVECLDRSEILARYRATRALTLSLTAPLAPEEFRIQSMPDVSPPWWNLGHTTWFFAKNVLEPFGLYEEGDARLEYVLNSYYESLGPRIQRDRRGLVTRPRTSEVLAFRASVDRRLENLIAGAKESDLPRLAFLVFTGIQHEQQHQELLVTEIKHILGTNVPGLREPYRSGERPAGPRVESPLAFVPIPAGLADFGNLEGGWCWDNEMPVHRAWLDPFSIANRQVSNREFLEFMVDGGYRNPLLWLSNGWAQVREQAWEAPLYWRSEGTGWLVWTLDGEVEVEPEEPVCHVSFYEADAYARWRSLQGVHYAGSRIPTEREWEQAARTSGFPAAGANFLESGALHPLPASLPVPLGVAQLGGDSWEWTTSHYEPYPRYRPFEGALMEYNGKFMDNQRVLRGGSCATPRNHIRTSYRNFWPADTRFQFSGIRLARDGG